MKWNQINTLLLGFILSLCWMGNIHATQLHPTDDNDDALIFTEEFILPTAVEEALADDILITQSAKMVHANNKAYVILSAGLCNSTGYNIHVIDARLEGDQLLVRAEVQSPQPGELVGWGFTQPIKIFSTPDENQEVKHLTVIYS